MQKTHALAIFIVAAASIAVAHGGEPESHAPAPKDNCIVIFKSLETMNGQILEQDDSTITLKVAFGSMKISMDKVLKIEGETDDQKAARKAAEELASKMKAEGKVFYKGNWVAKGASDDGKKKPAVAVANAKKPNTFAGQRLIGGASNGSGSGSDIAEYAKKFNAGMQRTLQNDVPDGVVNPLRQNIGARSGIGTQAAIDAYVKEINGH